MLTIASLGMFMYGIYSAGCAVADLIRGARLDLRAELGLMAFGSAEASCYRTEASRHQGFASS